MRGEEEGRENPDQGQWGQYRYLAPLHVCDLAPEETVDHIGFLLQLADRELDAGRPQKAHDMAAEALAAIRAYSDPASRVDWLATTGNLYERGGFRWGDAEDKAVAAVLAAGRSATGSGGYREGEVQLLYFYSPGCAECARVKPILAKIQREFPDVKIARHDLSIDSSLMLSKGVCVKMGLPKRHHAIGPTVISAREAQTGDDITERSLRELIQAARGVPAIWQTDPGLRALGGAGLERDFNDLTAFVVIGGGLVDGINPCAFAVIVFFITYMTFAGKSRREIALVGIYYTAAVFVTYLAIGLGLNKVFAYIPGVARLIVDVVMIGLLVLVAVLSFVDGLRCMKGRPEESLLKLPEGLKKRIHRTMTRRTREGLTAAGALSLGGLVALLESPCTGQVYAPIVSRVSRAPAGALPWLVLYNVCFILPLVVVFLCILFGLDNERLTALFKRHIAATKFALAIVFIALAVVLALTSLHYAGRAP